MEPNKKFSFEGLGSRANRPVEPRPSFPMMVPSNLPLTPIGSFPVWKKPYWMNHADGGGGSSSSGATKTHFQLSDVNAIANRPSATPANKAVNDIDGKNPKYESDDDPAGAGDHDHNNNKAKTVAVDGAELKLGKNMDVESMDPKRLRRIISNRASAQKSRLKKIQYAAEMERKAKALEAQIAFLAPQVEYYTHHKHFLQMEQKALNEQIAAYAKDKLVKDAEIEANKKELTRLRQLQLSQQRAHLEAKANVSSRLMNWGDARSMEKMVNPGFNQSGRGKMECSNSKQEKAGESSREVNVRNQLNVAQEKQQKQNQHQPGQASVASWEPAARQTESGCSNQSGTQPKGNNTKSDDGGGYDMIEAVMNFKTEQDQQD